MPGHIVLYGGEQVLPHPGYEEGVSVQGRGHQRLHALFNPNAHSFGHALNLNHAIQKRGVLCKTSGFFRKTMINSMVKSYTRGYVYEISYSKKTPCDFKTIARYRGFHS